MYKQAEPARSPVSGPGSGRTSGPPPQSSTVHLSSSTGRVRYGKGASDKRDEDQETSHTYEEAEAVKRDATYTPADTSTGGAGSRRALGSFVRSHRICMAAATAVVFSLVAVGLAMMLFINKEEMSKLSVTVDDLKRDVDNISQRDPDNERNQAAVMECLGRMNNTSEPDQAMKVQMQRLQTMVADLAAKDQKGQTEIVGMEETIQALKKEIQALKQRPYIERCESGMLKTPLAVFVTGRGGRSLGLTARFSRAFRTTPVVTLGLRQVDHRLGGIRVSATLVYVSTTNLTVQVSTWSNSQLYSASVYWMACA
ncbi:Hypp9114 [Branchiostoma lanceolatum]|uniref:Hypp9114 protein n=1 Tax=Branchiostoma lanceolatum TaxID=7740 RepID=A0A8K0EKK0_BRALA|nr:Hypp9114 [Branchiostoma lanceolatum]